MTTATYSHVGICVSDLEKSLRFYTEGLGFESEREGKLGDEVAGASELPPGIELHNHFIVKDGLRVELLWYRTPGPQGKPSSTRNTLGMTHIAFQVEDLAAMEERLVSLGGSVIESTRTHIEVGEGASADLFFLADPDGTRIEIIHRNGF